MALSLFKKYWLRSSQLSEKKELGVTKSTALDLDAYILQRINNPETGSGGRPYKVYTALLTQTGTNAPVATVLENTLGGSVSYLYNGVGVYSIVATGLLTVNKTTISFGGLNVSDGIGGSTTPNISSLSLDTFDIILLDSTGSSIEISSLPFVDNIWIRIEVYP